MRVKKRTKRVKKRTKRVKGRTKRVKGRTKRTKRTKRVKGRTRRGQTGGMDQAPAIGGGMEQIPPPIAGAEPIEGGGMEQSPPIAGSDPIEGEQDPVDPVDQVFINEDLIRKISGMGGGSVDSRFKWGHEHSPTSVSLSQTNRFLRDTLHQDDITGIQKRDFVAEIADSLPKGGVLGELKINPNLITYYVAGAYIAEPSGLGETPLGPSGRPEMADINGPEPGVSWGQVPPGVSPEEYNSWTSDRLALLPAVYLESHQKYLLEKFNNLSKLTLTAQHKDEEIRFNIDFFKYIKLPILQSLTLNDNGIQDLTPLQGLTRLTRLYLSDNQITDVGPLQGLTRLTHLGLNDNQITDVGPLQGQTRLTHLRLSGNQITDVGPLQGLTALTTLDLRGNPIEDVGPLQGLTRLTRLWLRDNQITDVGPLQGLTALTTLDLSDNQIEDVGPLQGLTELTYLDLEDNEIADVGPLQNLAGYTFGEAVAVVRDFLSLGTDPHPAAHPPLPGTEREAELLGLLRSARLNQEMWFARSDTTLWEQLQRILVEIGTQKMTTLKSLFLDNNKITDVGPLQGLTSLTTLGLWNNHIADATPLFSSDMAPDLHLRLSGNPLDLQDLQSHGRRPEGHFEIS